MNGLHWIAQILLAGVFIYIGGSKLFSYRRANRFLPAGLGFGTVGLSNELAVAIGIIEIAGALALVVPIDLWPPDVLPRLAAGGLALVAMTGAIYHMRQLRQHHIVPAGAVCHCGPLAALELVRSSASVSISATRIHTIRPLRKPLTQPAESR
jgi:hypothetical protein